MRVSLLVRLLWRRLDLTRFPSRRPLSTARCHKHILKRLRLSLPMALRTWLLHRLFLTTCLSTWLLQMDWLCRCLRLLRTVTERWAIMLCLFLLLLLPLSVMEWRVRFRCRPRGETMRALRCTCRLLLLLLLFLLGLRLPLLATWGACRRELTCGMLFLQG